MEDNENYSPVDALKTSSLVEVYKNDLEELREKGGVTTKEKKKIDDLISLINVIGQMPIDEPNMLMKIWQTYDP